MILTSIRRRNVRLWKGRGVPFRPEMTIQRQHLTAELGVSKEVAERVIQFFERHGVFERP